jgi:hypothetical protein
VTSGRKRFLSGALKAPPSPVETAEAEPPLRVHLVGTSPNASASLLGVSQLLEALGVAARHSTAVAKKEKTAPDLIVRLEGVPESNDTLLQAAAVRLKYPGTCEVVSASQLLNMLEKRFEDSAIPVNLEPLRCALAPSSRRKSSVEGSGGARGGGGGGGEHSAKLSLFQLLQRAPSDSAAYQLNAGRHVKGDVWREVTQELSAQHKKLSTEWPSRDSDNSPMYQEAYAQQLLAASEARFKTILNGARG